MSEWNLAGRVVTNGYGAFPRLRGGALSGRSRREALYREALWLTTLTAGNPAVGERIAGLREQQRQVQLGDEQRRQRIAAREARDRWNEFAQQVVAEDE